MDTIMYAIVYTIKSVIVGCIILGFAMALFFLFVKDRKYPLMHRDKCDICHKNHLQTKMQIMIEDEHKYDRQPIAVCPDCVEEAAKQGFINCEIDFNLKGAEKC